MKKQNIIARLIVVLVTLSTLLAFKPNYGTGTIYCFADDAAPVVIQSRHCADFLQPFSIRIDWKLSINPYWTANPCPTGYIPFDGSGWYCVQTTPGIHYYEEVAE